MFEPGFYCCDCVTAMSEFPDKFFDLAITDPVYGGVSQGGYMTHNNGQIIGGTGVHSKGYHDALWRQEKTGGNYFQQLFRVSKQQIVWGGQYFTEWLPPSQCWVVWDKQHPTKRSFADCELAFTSYNRASRIFRYLWDGFVQGDMKNKEHRIHPTQKPIALYEWLLREFAEYGYKILDTHVGSGSSLIACHNLGFTDVWGFEIDETYYQQAKKRIEMETAQMTIFSPEFYRGANNV